MARRATSLLRVNCNECIPRVFVLQDLAGPTHPWTNASIEMAATEKRTAHRLTSFSRYQEHVPGEAVLASSGDAWRNLQLRSHVLPAEQQDGAPAPAIPQHTLTFVYAPEIEGAHRTGGGPWRSFCTRAEGYVTVRPSGCATSLRWTADDPVRTLSLYLLPERLEDVGLQMGMAPSRIELRDRFNVADPILRRIAEQLRVRAEAEGTEDPIFLETAVQGLATRLLRRHSVTPPSEYEGGGLSRERLQRVERYVRAHLDANLSLDDLAQEVRLSKYYFSRRFKQRTGQSPYQFILYERVRAARRLLRKTTQPLARIALDVGFSSQSHFTRTFKRYVGVPPGRYRGAWH